MKVLVSWLRDLVEVPVETRRLAADLEERGFEVASVEPWPDGGADDAVIDLEITANRPDCLGMVGIAREVSVLYDRPLGVPAPPTPPDGAPALPITIEAPALCPRYAGALADVRVAASPAWLTARLAAAGIRAINNIVDVTNYVLVELGHPLHAFDFDKLAGGELRVRPARRGERVTTLDGQARDLDEHVLVIADRDRAQAVAGIMGGQDTEVSAATRVIALESACFQPQGIRRTSRRLGLSTEASHRFERGADPDAPLRALLRAGQLLDEIGAGHLRPGVVDVRAAAIEPRVVPLRLARVAALTGLDGGVLSAAGAERILDGLGFGPEPTGDGTWAVTVPSWRRDIEREADLVEEIARSIGYDRLPASFPTLHAPPRPPDARLARQRRARDLALATGFAECVTFSFVERAAAEAFANTADLVPIANPLAETFAVMRPSLLPGLVDVVSHNRRRERRNVRVFEIGARFTTGEGETRGLALAWLGDAAPGHWSGTARQADVYDLIGVLDALGARLGVALTYEPAEAPHLVEGRAARVLAGPRTPPGDAVALGFVGQLVPGTAEARALPPDEPVLVAEIDLDRLGAVAGDTGAVRVEPLPRHPSVVRDLSIVVPIDLPAAAVRGTIRSVAPATLVDVQEFARYQGQGVPAGRVSLSMRLTFRAADRTLTDAEVQEAVQAVIAALAARHDATLR